MKVDNHDLVIRIQNCSDAELISKFRNSVILAIQSIARIGIEEYDDQYEEAIYWQTQVLKALNPDTGILQIEEPEQEVLQRLREFSKGRPLDEVLDSLIDSSKKK